MIAAKRSVLIVEDEPLVRFLAAEDFEEAGFAVREAGHVAEALEIIAAEPEFDLLFTDIRMPGQLNGWDLGRLARESNPRLGVIYTSGFSGESWEPVDASVVVQKPYKFSDVWQAVKQIGLLD